MVAEGHGWARGAYVGTADELAADRQGTILGSTHVSTWILLEIDGATVANEYKSIALPSGRTAWLLESSVQKSAC